MKQIIYLLPLLALLLFSHSYAGVDRESYA